MTSSRLLGLLVILVTSTIAADQCTQYTKCRRALTQKYWTCSRASQRLTQHACRIGDFYRTHQSTSNEVNFFLEDCIDIESKKKSRFAKPDCNLEKSAEAREIASDDRETFCWSDLVRLQQQCFALARCCPAVRRCTDHPKYNFLRENEKEEKRKLKSLLDECQRDMISVMKVPLAREDREIAEEVLIATTELLTSFVPFDIRIPTFAVRKIRKSVRGKQRKSSMKVRRRYNPHTGRKSEIKFPGVSRPKQRNPKKFGVTRKRIVKASTEKSLHSGSTPRNIGKLVQVRPSTTAPLQTRGSAKTTSKITKNNGKEQYNSFYSVEKAQGYGLGQGEKHMNSLEKLPISPEGAGMLPEMRMVRQNEGKFIGFTSPKFVVLSEEPDFVDSTSEVVSVPSNAIEMIYDDLIGSNLEAFQGKFHERKTKSIKAAELPRKRFGKAKIQKKKVPGKAPTLEEYFKNTVEPSTVPWEDTTEPLMEAGIGLEGAWTMVPVTVEQVQEQSLPTYPKSLLSAVQPNPAYVLVKNGLISSQKETDDEAAFIFRNKNDTRRRKSIEDISGEVGDSREMKEIEGNVLFGKGQKMEETKKKKEMIRTTMGPMKKSTTKKTVSSSTIWATSNSPTVSQEDDYIDISEDEKALPIIDITTTRKVTTEINFVPSTTSTEASTQTEPLPTLISEPPFSPEDLLQGLTYMEIEDNLSSGERIDKLWPFYRKARYVARSVPILSAPPMKLPEEHPESKEMVEMGTPQCTKLEMCMREEIRLRELCTQKISNDQDECGNHLNYLNDVLERNELHLINFVVECIDRKKNRKDVECSAHNLKAIPENIGADCSKLPQLRSHCGQLSSCCQHGCDKEHTRNLLVQKAETIEKLILRNVEACEIRKKKKL